MADAAASQAQAAAAAAAAAGKEVAQDLLRVLINVHIAGLVLLWFCMPFIFKQARRYYKQFGRGRDLLVWKLLAATVTLSSTMYILSMLVQLSLMVTTTLGSPYINSLPDIVDYTYIFQRSSLIILGGSTESFFLWRAMKLTDRRDVKAVAIVCYLSTVGSFLTAIALIGLNINARGSPISRQVYIIDCVGFWGSFLINLTTSLTISYGMRRLKKAPGRPVFDVLTAWGQTALATSGVMMLSTFPGAVSGSLFVVRRAGIASSFWLHSYVPVSALCVLYSLNSRESFRRKLAPQAPATLEFQPGGAVQDKHYAGELHFDDAVDRDFPPPTTEYASFNIPIQRVTSTAASISLAQRLSSALPGSFRRGSTTGAGGLASTGSGTGRRGSVGVVQVTTTVSTVEAA